MSTKKIRLPDWDLIPAWYQLGLKGPSTLAITVHNNAVDFLRLWDFNKSTLVSHFQKRFGLSAFINPTEACWGFGTNNPRQLKAAFISGISILPGWTTWDCVLPHSKEGDNDNHAKFWAIRASLAALFLGLTVFGYDNNTGWKTPQLMTIDGLSVEADMGGGALLATLTPEMMKFLRRQGEWTELPEISEAMMRASQHMLKSRFGNNVRDYRAYCRQPKWINMSVPGNACGLDPDYHDERELEVGYRLCPHNVDSSYQQLTFLVGLAKLHELAQAFLDKNA